MEISKVSELKFQIPHADYEYAESAKIFDTKNLFLSKERIKPGKSASKPHFHSGIDEIIYILKGEAIAYEADKKGH